MSAFEECGSKIPMTVITEPIKKSVPATRPMASASARA
jgi:hypothetical protein